MIQFALYRKLIAAAVGILVMLVVKYSGLDLRGAEDALVDGVLALLTLYGVWAVPNRRPDEKTEDAP